MIPVITLPLNFLSMAYILHAHAENGSSSSHHDDRSPNRFSLFSLSPVEFAQHLTSHDAVSHDNIIIKVVKKMLTAG
jgi:hypothetical protein